MSKGNSKPQTRRRILESALPLFARAGYDYTSVKSIAEAAGVGHGTVFLHFLDKPHLYAEVIQLASDRFLTRMRERTATTCGTLAETLDGWIFELARCDDASEVLSADNRANRQPVISAAAGSVHARFVDFWQLRLERWFDAPTTGSTRLGELAGLIVFTASGFAAVRIEGKPVLKSTVTIEDFASAIEIVATRRQEACREQRVG